MKFYAPASYHHSMPFYLHTYSLAWHHRHWVLESYFRMEISIFLPRVVCWWCTFPSSEHPHSCYDDHGDWKAVLHLKRLNGILSFDYDWVLHAVEVWSACLRIWRIYWVKHSHFGTYISAKPKCPVFINLINLDALKCDGVCLKTLYN